MLLIHGETVNPYDNTCIIIVTRWKDKKDVNLISTCIDDNLRIQVRQARKEIEEPLVLFMGGVIAVQILSSYDCKR